MDGNLEILEEWIPEQMEPGTVFLLENPGKMGEASDPYVAVMSCPRCGTMGLITHRQITGLRAMICGSNCCSAEYHLRGEQILYRRPH